MNSKNKAPRCNGCNHTFESYGMSVEDAVKIEGKLYCCDDCQMEDENRRLEMEDYHVACGLNADGSEWY